MTPNVKITVTERNGRHCASTGSTWESAVGYSRAVRAGDFIFVTGTVGIEADGSYAPSLKAQTRRALDIIIAAVEALGGKAADIVRTRMFVTDIDALEGSRRGPPGVLRSHSTDHDHGASRPPDRQGCHDRDRGRCADP